MSFLIKLSIFFLLLTSSQILPTSALHFIDCDTKNFTNACVTSSLQILYRDEKVFTNFTNIFELFIVNSTVNFLPSNLNKIFPQLKRLEVRNCSLLEITENDLKFRDLSALDLSYNKIKKIGKIGNENLKILRLNHNEIYEIDENAFDGLENLQELKLDGNFCISEDEPNVQMMIEEVKRNCSISVVEKMTSMLKNVKDLDPTSMTLLVVMVLMTFAILVAICMRIFCDRFEYDIEDGKMELKKVVVTYEMPNENLKSPKLYPSLSRSSLNR